MLNFFGHVRKTTEWGFRDFSKVTGIFTFVEIFAQHALQPIQWTNPKFETRHRSGFPFGYWQPLQACFPDSLPGLDLSAISVFH